MWTSNQLLIDYGQLVLTLAGRERPMHALWADPPRAGQPHPQGTASSGPNFISFFCGRCGHSETDRRCRCTAPTAGRHP
jgi:hypothetical protein